MGSSVQFRNLQLKKVSCVHRKHNVNRLFIVPRISPKTQYRLSLTERQREARTTSIRFFDKPCFLSMSSPQENSNTILINYNLTGKKYSKSRRNDNEENGGRQRCGGQQRREGRNNRNFLVSKALSRLLRHAAEDAGIKLDSEAYARLDQVLEWQPLKSLQATFADVQRVVLLDEKQRYSMKLNLNLTQNPPHSESTDPSNWIIRANQGHSINIDSAKVLMPISKEAGNVPDTVIHGTYYSFYPSIIESGGLKKMTRTHIHFSTGLQKDGQKIISGMRRDAEILIYVDINASLNDGILWWMSENGVALTAGNDNGLLPVKYFKKVLLRNHSDHASLLWENGVEVHKLSESLISKWPRGKSHAKSILDRGRSSTSKVLDINQ
ncbi:tRNA 2'-phosphotransferase 1 [Golovinomyces cichoracearum]|uniref:2'-phosphotransferase n=1 Tax=Golovinomyces cichoracearum TaxID=62708 RepID=A0A420IAM7_9PEZI|nr:tRNA 2'-phosphotransferase 1 [Golovinomyces cichoracearum]